MIDAHIEPLRGAAGAVLLQIPIGKEPPAEFRIFRAGSNDTSKGVFLFDEKAAASVMAAFAEHGMDRLPIDFDHGMFSLVPTSDTGRAAGWFVPAIRNTEDGLELWATEIEWTPRADTMLRDREFRFISPAFETDKSNRVNRLLNVALTNLPATKNLDPLVANQTDHNNRKETEKMSADKLRKEIGADDDAQAIAIVRGWNGFQSRLVELTGAKSIDDILAKVETSAKNGTKVVELAARVAELENEKETAQRVELLAKAPPSMREVLGDLPVAQLASVVERLNVAFPGGKETSTPPDKNGAGPGGAIKLSIHDRKMMKQFGISEEDYRATIELKAAEAAELDEEAV